MSKIWFLISFLCLQSNLVTISNPALQHHLPSHWSALIPSTCQFCKFLCSPFLHSLLSPNHLSHHASLIDVKDQWCKQQVEKLSVREGCHTSQILTVNLRPQLVSWFSRHNYIIKGMKTWCEVVGNDKAVKEDVKGSILVLVMEKDLLRWSTGDTPAILWI